MELILLEAKAHGGQGDDSQHGFTKGKSCLTNLVAVYDGMTRSAGKGSHLSGLL